MAINRQLLHWSRTIHVYLSIALLIILVFFAITGITLNNASVMTGSPQVSTVNLDKLPELPRSSDNQIMPSPELERFLRNEFGVRLNSATINYEDEYMVVDYQAPGKEIIIEIDQALNEAFMERTDFGLIAVVNDLHKGRHVDIIISWLIDISGIILVIFSLAGFILLLPNKRRFKKVTIYSAVAILLMSAGYYLGHL